MAVLLGFYGCALLRSVALSLCRFVAGPLYRCVRSLGYGRILRTVNVTTPQMVKV